MITPPGRWLGRQHRPDVLAPPLRASERVAGSQIRELYQTIFPCGDAELWAGPA
jgi:hypothetical protein